MEQYFLYLHDLRSSRPDDLFFKTYQMLMSTEGPLTNNQEQLLKTFLSATPKGQDEIHHYVWGLNALSRYYCYGLQNFELAKKYQEETLRFARKLFTYSFPVFEKETKSLPLLVDLNFARINFLAGNVFQALEQLSELEKKLMDAEENIKSSLLSKIENERKKPRLLQAIQRHTKFRPEETAFFDYDSKKDISWRDFYSSSLSLAEKLNAYKKSGVRQAFVLTRHSMAFPTAVCACWLTGIVPIMISDEVTPYEFKRMKEVVRDENPLILLERELAPKKLPARMIEFSSGETDTLSSFVPEKIPSELALGLFTSGTTNSPKLIVFTHEDLFMGAFIESENERTKSDARIANLRPHFTSGGLNTLWPALLKGASHILSEKIRKAPVARYLFEMISEQSLDLLVLSPSYLLTLIESFESDGPDANGIPVYFGGMALPERARQLLLRHGLLPSMRYGMTEVVHIVSKVDMTKKGPFVRNVVGKPVPQFKVLVREHKLEFEGQGIASFQMKEGQFFPLKAGNRFLTDDFGELNEKGEIVLFGRDSRIICVNGFRFNCLQVENVLQDSGLVKDCRVIGIPHEKQGEEVIAFCIGDENHEVKEICKNTLSRFKRPSRYIWLNDWPYTANGKINFTQLKALAQRKDD